MLAAASNRDEVLPCRRSKALHSKESQVLAAIATFLVNSVVAGLYLAVFTAFMVYFAYRRYRPVANSPDEEFAMLTEAESRLA